MVAFLAFLGFCNLYALRVNLSVAIVAMTTNRTINTENGTVIEVMNKMLLNICWNFVIDLPMFNMLFSCFQPAEFDWDPGIRGLILSSFFYGYIVTQLPGGYLASAYGGGRLVNVIKN